MAKQRTIDNATGGMTEGDQESGGALRQLSPFTGMGPDQQGQPNLGMGGEDPSGILKQVSTPIDPVSAQSGESPRERDAVQNPNGPNGAAMGGAPSATLRRPSSPTPMAGSSFTASSGGVMPFTPMEDSTDSASLTTPSGPTSQLRGSLFGSQGGLKGGGLGVPLDPVSDQQSDPISKLIQLLQRS